MPGNTPPRRAALLAAGAIALAALAAYADSFRGPFVFDDLPSIPDNPTLRSLGAALSPPSGHGITVQGRPLLNLSFALNYAIGGTAVEGYHLGNLLIHVLAALALFGVVRRTLECSRIRENPEEPRFLTEPATSALAVALLWAVHPLQTESVTYLVQRAESLMGLFYLLTLYCFIRGAQPSPLEKGATAQPGGVWWWHLLSFLSCLCGMATKEVMVSAPLMVLLYDRIFLAGSWREALRRRGRAHLALASTWILLAWLAAGSGSRGGTSGFGSGVFAPDYWATQFDAAARYLGLVLWPSPLVFDYGTEWLRSPAELALPALLVLWLAALTLLALRRLPRAGYLGVCFFALLAPTSLVPGNRQTMAEHRMYLPSAAVIAVLVLGVRRLAVRRGLGPRPLAVVGAVLAALCVFLTLQRNRVYASSLDLYRDCVAKKPDNAFARYNLGKALDDEGRAGDAIPNYREAVRLRPDLVDPVQNLGNALSHAGRLEEAAAQYEAAVRLRPRMPQAHYNLGNTLVQLGRKAEAVPQFEEALRLKPDYLEARDNLGSALLELGRPEEAIPQYQAVLRANPGFFETHFNLGTAYRLTGRGAEAAEQFEIALRLRPDFAPARAALEKLR